MFAGPPVRVALLLRLGIRFVVVCLIASEIRKRQYGNVTVNPQSKPLFVTFQMLSQL